MKKNIAIKVILLLFSIYISITPVYAQNEVSVKEQNIYTPISDEEIKNILVNGTPEDLKNLLDKKIDVNIDYGCSTLLNKAIQSLIANQNPAATPEDTLEKVKMLIDAGADVNLATCGLTPLATLTGIPDFAKKNGKNIHRNNNVKYRLLFGYVSCERSTQNM